MRDDLTLAEIAALFGLTRSAAQRLAREGLFLLSTRSRAGRFDLAKSAQTYTAHLREIARNRSGSAAAQATIRLKQSAAELNELKTKRLSGELIEMSVAGDMIKGFARTWRAAFLSLPSRIRTTLRLPGTMEEKIEKVVDERLDELAEEIEAQKGFGSLPRIALNPASGVASKGPYHAKSGPRRGANGGNRHDDAEP